MPSNDSDPLASLRQSIARAVEHVQKLSAERQDLEKQLTGLRNEVDSLQVEMRRLQELWRSDVAELRRLRALTEGRDRMRERLSHLLSRLDSLYLAQ